MTTSNLYKGQKLQADISKLKDLKCKLQNIAVAKADIDVDKQLLLSFIKQVENKIKFVEQEFKEL